jgi:hypothetical protein
MKITEKKLRQIIREAIDTTAYRGRPKRPSAMGPAGKAIVTAVVQRLKRQHPDVAFEKDLRSGVVTVNGVIVSAVGKTYDELEVAIFDAIDRSSAPH